MSSTKLTEIQKHSLTEIFELSVAHPKYKLVDRQAEIISSLPQIFNESISTTHKEIGDSFIDSFFRLANQPAHKLFNPPIFHYSTSMSIEVLGNVFRQKSMRAALITPTFDNLADIIKRHIGESLIAVEEVDLNYPERIPWDDFDALFITIPNNPTGFFLGKDSFTALVKACRQNNKLLAIDFCFRLTVPEYRDFDQYQILNDEGVDFITYEDTGKIWSIADLKVGFMISSNSYYQIIKDISGDMLLSVSPFTLNLLSHLIENEDPESIYINKITAINREFLRSKLSDLNFKLANPDSKSTVEWVIHNRSTSATQLVERLEEFGVYLTPGGPYFWNDHSHGEKYLRIVLARDPDVFKSAIEGLIRSLSEIG